MKAIIKLAHYLQRESYDSEFLFLQDLIKNASEKDAKYLAGINLGALRKEFPREEGQDPKEYYRMLNQLAIKGPYFSSKAIEFIRNNIDEDLIPANRKEFIKWLATELNKASDRQYPDVNDIAMIKDWLMGSGWPDESAIVLEDLDLEYALMASKEWHDRPTGPIIAASEIEKKVVYSFSNGSKIVYEPIASVDPVARKKLGQKLGLCLRDGLFSNDEEGKIYSIRSPSGRPGACIRIRGNAVKEIKGPGNHASSITISNSKMIKEWLKEGAYTILGMGKTDYDRMPPTSWAEAKRVWDKSRANFIRKGWFRGYREEFRPELIKTLESIFSEHRGKDHTGEGYLLRVLLKERVHHVYLNEFSKHLDDIAKNYPEIYLLNNLPKTYSSATFSKTHEDAVDHLAEIRPNKIIDYLNIEYRRNIFSENIIKMIKKREEFAVNKLLNMSEIALERKSREGIREDDIDPVTGRVFKVSEEPVDAPSSYWQIESFFRNHSILKKHPEIAAKILKNLEDMYPNEDEFPFDKALKGIVKTRLYRRGGIFKRLVENAVEAIENSLNASEQVVVSAPEAGLPADLLPGDLPPEDFRSTPPSLTKGKQWSDLYSLFSLGLHTAKEYKHLTDPVANKLLDEHEGEKGRAPNWNRLAKLVTISDETKKRLADLYLDKTLADRYSRADYLRNKIFYKNPLFLETTIRAIKSTDIFRTYAKRRDVERNSQVSREKEDPQRYSAGLPVRHSGTSDYSRATLPTLPHRIDKWMLLGFFPRLIKETEGIVPIELTHDMREALIDVAKKEDLTTDNETNNFLRKATSRKNFPKLYDFIIKNTLQDHRRSLFSSLQKLNEERHPTRHLQMHVLGNMLWDLKQSVRMLHLVRKYDLHSELEELPDFIRLFGKFNYTLAEKLQEYIKYTIENNLNPDNYNNQVHKQIGVLRMYINFGWHRSSPLYSEELSSAIEEVSKSLFPAIKDLYEKELEINKMSGWRIFGPRNDVDKYLIKYYYDDPDYPESLVYKDKEFIEFLKEELINLGGKNPRAREEAFGEFIYGFMYWSVSTFNEMGEEAANQEADIETYIEQMKDIWPKRTGLGYDEFFQKGFNFRDKWERTSYDGPWKPVPYEEEEVEQQLSKDYMQEYYEDLNEPIHEEEEGQEDLERLKQERWGEGQTKAETESVEEAEEESFEPPQEASGGDPEEGHAWRADRPYRLAGFVSGPIKRGRVRKALLSKKYLLNI